MDAVKQLLSTATLLALFSPSVNVWAQYLEAPIRRPTLIACNPPEWSQEARRYELEGTTVLQYSVDGEGRPSSVRVARSSGWKILDQMAIRAMGGCRFEPPIDPNIVRTGLRIPYDWKLEDNGQRVEQAALVPDSCTPSKHLEKFLPIKGKLVPRDDGILVRFLLDENGNTFGIKVEETDPAPINVATAYIQSCRFSPAMLDGKPVRGNLLGWLILKKIGE